MDGMNRFDRLRPTALGWLLVVFILGIAVAGAWLTGSTTGRITHTLDTLAATTGDLVATGTAVLPLGYAFGAGMVAAVNPCGFALLPAYLGLYLGSGGPRSQHRSVRHNLGRAIWVSLSVTAGFVVLFGIAGLIISGATVALAEVVPWLGLLVGLLLIIAGGRMISGATFGTTLGNRLVVQLGPTARHANSRGYFAYGLAYGAASLSCTLPIFLTVVGSALTVGGLAAALFQFVVYALGMGCVITALTLSMAVFKGTLMGKLRVLGRYMEPASAGLLLLAGGYIVYYWLTIGGLLAAVLGTG